MEILRIPHERVAVLIGSGGETKRAIEKATGIKLAVSEEGEVEIESADALAEWRARDVVKAIGRGFNPRIALKLLREDMYLEIVSLRDLLPTKKAIERQRGRVIGEGGKAWLTIEELSGANISVYGDTIAFIGSHEAIVAAKEAVLEIVGGRRHAAAFRQLARRKG